MSETFDIWRLLAGLGIFLLGIFLMEDSVKEIAGKTFKKIIRSYTDTRLSAIFSGTLSTAILQSSSAVNLMVLAFVGAGIMSLGSAIGVILGSNIGTTLTAWIVAVFGFKISIESFALPMIAIGGLGLIFFANSSRYLNISKLLIGFGLLFHGLDYMKTSVDQLTQFFDIAVLAGYGLWVFVLAGIIFTAVIQSSSATIAIVLTALHSGLLGFDSGAAMVIGANVGTTATVILGAVGGIPNKKRVAFGHFAFNVLTGIVAFVLLPILTEVIQLALGDGKNGIIGIALFHTIFNLLGVLLFLPFISQFTSKLNDLYREPERVLTHFIQNTSPEIADAALEAFRKEILHQYVGSRRYLINLYNMDLPEELAEDAKSELQSLIKGQAHDSYWQLEELHGNIFEYYSKIDSKQLDEEETKLIQLYLRSSRSIMNATKNLKEVRDSLEDFELSDNDFLNKQFTYFQNRLVELFRDLDSIVTKPGDRTGNNLNEVLERVEIHDEKSISESSKAIKKEGLTDLEATSMVMVNRLFTQSCRMFVLSIRNLLQQSGPEADRSI